MIITKIYLEFAEIIVMIFNKLIPSIYKYLFIINFDITYVIYVLHDRLWFITNKLWQNTKMLY